jgi:two-component system sensor histidine kinase CpxA
MIIVIGLVVVLSPTWTRVKQDFLRWERQVYARLTNEAERAAELLLQDGPENLRESLSHFGPPFRVTVYLIDQLGDDHYDQEVPKGVAGLAARARDGGQTELEREGRSFLAARPVTTSGGDDLVLVIVRSHGGHGPGRRPPRPIELLNPRALVPLLGLIVLVVGGLCYWLARYLTAPVSALRSATRRLSGGDLSARVGDRVGRRRDEIGDLARDFDAMAGRLETLIGSQRRLIRDVSHELRSPLARLEVALELARRRAGEDADEPLDRIEREAHRLDEMIEHLLALGRLESGAAVPDPMTIEMAALLKEIVADAEYETRARKCTVELSCETESRVEGSRDLLRSALENVVRNAVAYTADGTTVEITCGVTDEPSQPFAVIQVRDRGRGVPDDELEHLFEPFYRVSESRDRNSGGTGLGLAITARSIRLHGGCVNAHNHPEGGLVVTIQLPAAGGEPEE